MSCDDHDVGDDDQYKHSCVHFLRKGGIWRKYGGNGITGGNIFSSEKLRALIFLIFSRNYGSLTENSGQIFEE